MADRNSCDLCPKIFARRIDLSHHRQTHSDLKSDTLIHTGEKPHKCTECKYSTNDLGNLRRHIKKHTGEKPHKCNKCDFASNQSSHLKIHKRTHSGEKPHRCTMCEFSSVTTGQLKVHMRRQHTGEKPFFIILLEGHQTYSVYLATI